MRLGRSGAIDINVLNVSGVSAGCAVVRPAPNLPAFAGVGSRIADLFRARGGGRPRR